MNLHKGINRLWRARIFVRLFLLTGIILIPVFFMNSCSSIDLMGESKRKEKKSEKKSGGKLKEVWRKESGAIHPGLRSTSSMVLPDETVRCYFAQENRIYYLESENGQNFGDRIETNLGSELIGLEGEKIADPAVLMLRSGRFMLLFKSETEGVDPQSGPGPAKLHLAYSNDGIAFEYQGVVADRGSDQFALVEQADAVLLNDGSIRLFSAENGISTAISKDGGKTWITDGIELIEKRASEPDVHIEPDGTYIMYYVVSNDSNGGANQGANQENTSNQKPDLAGSNIEKAVSSDGLNWKIYEKGKLSSDKESGAVFNPDYVSLGNKKEMIYFSEAEVKEDHAEIEINWRLAIPSDN